MRSALAHVFTMLLIVMLPQLAWAQPPGSWGPNRSFNGANGAMNAIHASLIPVGANRGKILVWEFGSGAAGLRWAILNPVTANVEFDGFEPTPADELFCSGHAWTKDGRLFVAGGWRPNGGSNIGSPEAWIYDPDLPPLPFGKWIRQLPSMQRARYYPAVVATRDAFDTMLVLGGGPTINIFAANATMTSRSFGRAQKAWDRKAPGRR